MYWFWLPYLGWLFWCFLLLFHSEKCKRSNSNIPFKKRLNFMVFSNSSPLQNQILLSFCHMKQSKNKTLLLLSCFNQQEFYCIVSFPDGKKKTKKHWDKFIHWLLLSQNAFFFFFFLTLFYWLKLHSRRILKYLSVCFK